MDTAITNNGLLLNNNLFIKREDLIPYSFGGNKARKARLFFQIIDSEGYDYVVTYGSCHSNHCRIVANMAAERGLKCDIIAPEEVLGTTFNSVLMEMFGARITKVPVSDVHDVIEIRMEELSAEGYKPYFIEGGGHGNVGTEAYIQCYDEIRDYEKENDLYFQYIFFASGTGTTQAGLVCGQLLCRDAREIVGISIARKNPRGRNIVFHSVKSYLNANQINIADKEIRDRILFIDDYTGNGYAWDMPEIMETIREVMIYQGIPLDSTYTGKAFWGMKQYIKENRIMNKNILFIHTGGTPLFFDGLKNL